MSHTIETLCVGRLVVCTYLWINGDKVQVQIRNHGIDAFRGDVWKGIEIGIGTITEVDLARGNMIDVFGGDRFFVCEDSVFLKEPSPWRRGHRRLLDGYHKLRPADSYPSQREFAASFIEEIRTIRANNRNLQDLPVGRMWRALEMAAVESLRVCRVAQHMDIRSKRAR